MAPHQETDTRDTLGYGLRTAAHKALTDSSRPAGVLMGVVREDLREAAESRLLAQFKSALAIRAGVSLH